MSSIALAPGLDREFHGDFIGSIDGFGACPAEDAACIKCIVFGH